MINLLASFGRTTTALFDNDLERLDLGAGPDQCRHDSSDGLLIFSRRPRW